jgi:hypothetical protein
MTAAELTEFIGISARAVADRGKAASLCVSGWTLALARDGEPVLRGPETVKVRDPAYERSEAVLSWRLCL